MNTTAVDFAGVTFAVQGTYQPAEQATTLNPGCPASLEDVSVKDIVLETHPSIPWIGIDDLAASVYVTDTPEAYSDAYAMRQVEAVVQRFGFAGGERDALRSLALRILERERERWITLEENLGHLALEKIVGSGGE